MEGQYIQEMEALNIRDNQVNNEYGPHSGEASVATNPDGKGLRFSKRQVIFGILGVVAVLALIISVTFNIIQAGRRCQVDPGTSGASLRSQDWVEQEGMSYFFSKVEGDWNASLSDCLNRGASLAVIETAEEMVFIKKNRAPGELYWLGILREKVQEPFKRLDGSVFNSWYRIENEGHCAYLNEQVVSSTDCTNKRCWICKKRRHGS
ncbi:C-type lectin domain family 2 member B-like [Paroedura picta]|uniref:C-type lectin domain family 2 member B-like n=1 Tax=Paroedura picta TaxID=143630 RepID=UPI004056C059